MPSIVSLIEKGGCSFGSKDASRMENIIRTKLGENPKTPSAFDFLEVVCSKYPIDVEALLKFVFLSIEKFKIYLQAKYSTIHLNCYLITGSKRLSATIKMNEINADFKKI